MQMARRIAFACLAGLVLSLAGCTPEDNDKNITSGSAGTPTAPPPAIDSPEAAALKSNNPMANAKNYGPGRNKKRPGS